MWKPTLRFVTPILLRILALPTVSVKSSFAMVRIVQFIPRGCLMYVLEIIRVLRGPTQHSEEQSENFEESS